MPDVIFLTKDDEKLLKDFIAVLRSGRKNRPIQSVLAEVNQSSDIYIARIPPDGIDGIVVTGTADDGPIDVSYAECEIYKIEDGGLVASGFQETVFNLSLCPIHCSVAIVKLDRYGEWVVDRPGSFWGATIGAIPVNETGSVEIWNEDGPTGIIIDNILNPSMDLPDASFVNVGEMYAHLEMYPRTCIGGTGTADTGGDGGYSPPFAASHG